MRQADLEESKKVIPLLYGCFGIPLTDSDVERYMNAPATLGYRHKRGDIMLRANPAAQIPPLGLIVNAKPPDAMSSGVRFNPLATSGREAALRSVRCISGGSSVYILTNGVDRNRDKGLKVATDIWQPERWDELFGPVPFERYVFEVKGNSVLWAVVVNFEDVGIIFTSLP